MNDGRGATTMRIEGPAEQPMLEELDLLTSLLPLEGAHILELGCGAAEKTQAISENTGVARILAAEVDAVQHRKNLERTDLPKIHFAAFGAESIEAPDNVFDVVLLFKSLHHVAVHHMDAALREISRVLKPGGLVYISEPVFAGDFNEVIRLFHDESGPRRAAFDAEVKAVENGVLELHVQRFFESRMRLQSFAQFEERILNATHTAHRVTPEVLAQVRERFEAQADPEGYTFHVPIRVDLMRKPL